MSTLARFAPQLHFIPPSASAEKALSSSKIGATQSYSTIHGNALTVRFNQQLNNNSSSQMMVPLNNPLALASCESSVLETWFSELAKPRFGMHKNQYGVPLDDVRQKIGIINTCYHSTSPFLDSKRRVPFAGSAEFSMLPHRQELNFSVTLWDEWKRPLSTTLWTGPKGKFGGGPMGVQMSNDEVEMEMKKMKRIPMQDFQGRSDGNNNNHQTSSSSTTMQQEDQHQTSNELTSSSFDRLFVPEIPHIEKDTLVKTTNGGYSIFMLNESKRKIFLEEGASNNSNNVVPLMTVPIHDACLCEFASQVWKDIMKQIKGNKKKGNNDNDSNNNDMSCRMVSKTATLSAVNYLEPFELRSAPPLFTPKLFTKPWEHKTGLPNLRGEPCLGLRIETIQGDEVCGVGTYYFTSGF